MSGDKSDGATPPSAHLDLRHGFHQKIIQHLLQEARYFDSKPTKTRKKLKLVNSHKKPARLMYTIPAKRSLSECDDSMKSSESLSEPEITQKEKSFTEFLALDKDIDVQPSKSVDGLLKEAIRDPISLGLCDIFHVGRDLVHTACKDVTAQSRVVSIYGLIYKNEVESAGDKCTKYRLTLSMCAVITMECQTFTFPTILSFLQHIMFATIAVKKEAIVTKQICQAIMEIVGKCLDGSSLSKELIPDICCVLTNTGRYIVHDCRDQFVHLLNKVRRHIPHDDDEYSVRLLKHLLSVCDHWLVRCQRLACHMVHQRAA